MRRRPSTALLLALLTGACALGFKRPTVGVAEVRLAGLSLTGGEVRVLLTVANPNKEALVGEGFRYALDFAQDVPGGPDWLRLSEGESTETVRIPGEGRGEVAIVLPFAYATAGRALSSLLRQGELEYRFTGELRVRTRFGRSRVPFDERGLFRP